MLLSFHKKNEVIRQDGTKGGNRSKELCMIENNEKRKQYYITFSKILEKELNQEFTNKPTKEYYLPLNKYKLGSNY